eukprot:CAMPEP_0180138504 /NCGR_PEP_ID=MMETSP0986-20121125/12937_1 /TAXON_ID=697907 /ORGANISM="non described non described, Strain CCMP2293" /LENGTH=343 /DNA_ID=CAMNT_0022080349 /DNA_START=111 /DNA_END=1143 /DNA_ORIENTATION=+
MRHFIAPLLLLALPLHSSAFLPAATLPGRAGASTASWLSAASPNRVPLRSCQGIEMQVDSKKDPYSFPSFPNSGGRVRSMAPMQPVRERFQESAILRFSGDGLKDALGAMERFDDQIMGGISQSNMISGTAKGLGTECGVFAGVVRVQGGGFVGCRTKILSEPLDGTGFTGIYLKTRGEEGTALTYKLNIRDGPTSNEVVYQTEFTPPPSPDFRQSASPSRETDFNTMFKAGRFRLEVEEIGFYRDPRQMAAYIDDFPADKLPPVVVSQAVGGGDTLNYRADGTKRSWFKRFFFKRLRKELAKRVAKRRSGVAQELLDARKNGITLSQWRKDTQAPPVKEPTE